MQVPYYCLCAPRDRDVRGPALGSSSARSACDRVKRIYAPSMGSSLLSLLGASWVGASVTEAGYGHGPLGGRPSGQLGAGSEGHGEYPDDTAHCPRDGDVHPLDRPYGGSEACPPGGSGPFDYGPHDQSPSGFWVARRRCRSVSAEILGGTCHLSGDGLPLVPLVPSVETAIRRRGGPDLLLLRRAH